MMEQDIQIDLKGLSVMVGMPAGRDLPGLTVKSLMGTQSLCRDVGVPFQFGMVIGSAVVQWARDEVIDLFLQSNATRLFWIDSDMVWEPEQFMRLLALSQYRDVICAAYPAKKIGHPREVAQMIVFLISDDSSYVNASAMVVDGGLLSKCY